MQQQRGVSCHGEWLAAREKEYCDGQVLVFHDLVNLLSDSRQIRSPFYGDAAALITHAVLAFKRISFRPVPERR